MTIVKFNVGIILFVLTASSCHYKSQKEMSAFAGMWKLDKYEAFDSLSGKWHAAPNRLGYSGYILYDGKGHMGVQLLPPEFNDLEKDTNIDSLENKELKKKLKLYSASFNYFANCNLISGTKSIEHHIISSNNPADGGTTVKRNLSLKVIH